MLEETKFKESLNYYDDSALLSYKLYTNAMIIPNEGNWEMGVVEENGYFVDNSHLHNQITKSSISYITPPKKLHVSSNKCLYLGTICPIWGHLITDCLKNLWFFISNKGKQLIDEGYIIGYVSTDNKDLPVNYQKILNYLGIDIEKVKRITVPTKFKSVVVPDSSFYLNKDETRHYTKEYIDTIDAIIAQATKGITIPKEKRNVYFTRSRIKKNKDYGEKNIENIFKNLGFEIYSPETLTLEQQIEILQGCETFATTEGSVSHNAIFLKPGTKVIIVRKVHSCTGYQFTINSARNLDATWIDAHLSIFVDKKHPWTGPFFMYVNENIRSFAKDNGLEIPYKPFPFRRYRQYIINSLVSVNNKNRKEEELTSRYVKIVTYNLLRRHLAFRLFVCKCMYHLLPNSNIKYKFSNRITLYTALFRQYE